MRSVPRLSPLRATAAAALGLALALVSGLASAAPTQSVAIDDLDGFGRPVRAATVEIPAGWRAEGGIRWDRSTDCVANRMRFNWRASAPDGRTAYEIMPGLSWQVAGTENPFNPCPAVPLNSARSYLERVISQRHPGARVIQYRDRQDLSSQMARNAAPNPNGRSRFDAGQILIGYREGNVEMREVLTAMLSFSEAQGNVVGGVPTVSALRSPDGALDFALADRIGNSMKADRQWIPMMQQATQRAIQDISDRQAAGISARHNRRMAEINARGSADRAAIALESNREVAQIYSNVWNNGQDTDARIHARNKEAIGEYRRYGDPANDTTVHNSIHNGPRVFSHGSNAPTYTATDDPYAQPDPYNGTELERIP
ncbi:MAG: hypothetical protein C0434_16855 [Xanthomonadaceae bacterium]|nr:hypothetical protein [Xanthomonadaceae bacterium]